MIHGLQFLFLLGTNLLEDDNRVQERPSLLQRRGPW